jgi:hypothetical protein
MSIRRILAGLALAILSFSAQAQGVAGKWSATMNGAQGAMLIVFNFVVDGGELTGVMSSEFMGDIPIADGKIDGNVISFSINVPAGPGGAATMGISGELAGDELTLAADEGSAAGGTDQALVFKRVE